MLKELLKKSRSYRGFDQSVIPSREQLEDQQGHSGKDKDDPGRCLTSLIDPLRLIGRIVLGGEAGEGGSDGVKAHVDEIMDLGGSLIACHKRDAVGIDQTLQDGV